MRAYDRTEIISLAWALAFAVLAVFLVAAAAP